MTQLISMPEAFQATGAAPQDRARWCCERLEEGNILFFPQTPFEFPQEGVQFLLSQPLASSP